jgi:hypothetical protein
MVLYNSIYLSSKFKAREVSHIEICGTAHNAEDEFTDKQVGVKHFSRDPKVSDQTAVNHPPDQ